MKRNLIRNISWIALLAVWSFLAGAYFHLGWVRDATMNYFMSFYIGGFGVWIVFTGVGLIVHRFAKNSGSKDPVKPSLVVVSFFTVCFLLIAWIKYDEVVKDKFVEDMEDDFIMYYKTKAAINGVQIRELAWELEGIYASIQYDLKRYPKLDQLMELKSADALFDKNHTIANMCLEKMELNAEIGYPSPAGMEKLFTK